MRSVALSLCVSDVDRRTDVVKFCNALAPGYGAVFLGEACRLVHVLGRALPCALPNPLHPAGPESQVSGPSGLRVRLSPVAASEFVRGVALLETDAEVVCDALDVVREVEADAGPHWALWRLCSPMALGDWTLC